ncbi:hypothetical protein [Streptomyces sp. NPDC021608]|uniref:hypothetical protein n=1 Tax=Streptomyces sp. NPDC021608 TaxID=3154903 RepID=UPI0033FE0062
MKITFCAGAAVVAAVLVPTAYAAGDGGRDAGGRGGGARGGGGGVSVSPALPSPGSEVTVKATGCGGRTATAVSAAFVADARLVVADGPDGALVGDTRVRSSLPAGGYDVRITCAGGRVKGRIDVRRPASAPPDAPPDEPSALSPAAAPIAPSPSAAPADSSPATPALPPASGASVPPLVPPAAPVPPASAVPPVGSSAVPSAGSSVSSGPPVVSVSPVAPVRAGGGDAAPVASAEEVRADGHGPGRVQAVVGLVLAGVTAAVVVCRGLRRSPGTR